MVLLVGSLLLIIVVMSVYNYTLNQDLQDTDDSYTYQKKRAEQLEDRIILSAEYNAVLNRQLNEMVELYNQLAEEHDRLREFSDSMNKESLEIMSEMSDEIEELRNLLDESYDSLLEVREVLNRDPELKKD